MEPRDLGLNFDSFRPLQLETACRIVATEKQFIILQAPPGAGKSLLAMTAAKLNASINGNGRTVVVVSTRQLQEQYVDTLDVPSIKGRANYICPVAGNQITCDAGPCYVGRGCDEKSKWAKCPYYQAKLASLQAPECVLNLSYFLTEANYVGGFSGVDLLVIDEAHLLESAISQFVGISFSGRMLDRFNLPRPNPKKELTFESIIEWAELCIPLVTDKIDALNDLTDSLLEIPGADLVKEKNALENVREKFASAIEACRQRDNWVIYKDDFSFELKPVRVDGVAKRILWKHLAEGGKVILMSATILDWKEMARALGIEQNNVEWIELPAVFAADNRPVNYWPVAKVNGGKKLDESIDKVIMAVDQILSMFPKDKGVIHTVSNDLTRRIIYGSRYSKRFIHHLNRPREDVINEFINSKKPLVLVSPSVAVGLDLPDDAGRFQIIAKIQFPNLGDPIVQARMTLSDSWYAAQAARSLIQACFSSDTEILTSTGWKEVDEIVVGDTIFGCKPSITEKHSHAFSNQNVHIVRGKIESILRRTDTSLISIKGKGIDALVTPDHDMLIIPNAKRLRARKIAEQRLQPNLNGIQFGLDKIKAGALHELPRFLVPLGGNISWQRPRLEPQPLRHTEHNGYDWLWLIGLIFADGHFRKIGNQIDITQSIGGRSEIIKQALDRLGIRYTTRTAAKNGSKLSIGGKEYTRQADTMHFIITGVDATRIKKLILDGKLRKQRTKVRYHYDYPKIDKSNLPLWILNQCSSDQLQAFIDGFIFGDGSENGPNSRMLYNTNKPLMDLLQACAVLSGHRCSMRSRTRSRNGYKVAYELDMCNRPWTDLITKNAVSEIHLEEPVPTWCVGTNIGSVVVRRNGKVFIAGNTGRVVRHEQDQGVNFVLDSNCSWFMKKHNSLFPQWWKDSFHKIGSAGEAVMPSHFT